MAEPYGYTPPLDYYDRNEKRTNKLDKSDTNSTSQNSIDRTVADKSWGQVDVNIAIAEAKFRLKNPISEEVGIKEVHLSGSGLLSVHFTRAVRFPSYMLDSPKRLLQPPERGPPP